MKPQPVGCFFGTTEMAGAKRGGGSAISSHRSLLPGCLKGWKKCWWQAGREGVQVEDESENPIIGWWFQIFFMFTPKIGKGFQFDRYFSNGLKPPTR